MSINPALKNNASAAGNEPSYQLRTFRRREPPDISSHPAFRQNTGVHQQQHLQQSSNNTETTVENKFSQPPSSETEPDKLNPQNGHAGMGIGLKSADREIQQPASADTDPDNPRIWSKGKKVWICLFVLLSGFVATIGTPIYIAAIPPITGIFHVALLHAIVPASTYAFGIGIGALLLSSLSEFLGRPLIYRITTPLCILFTVIGGASTTLPLISVSRFLSGFLAGPWMTIGAGIMSDVFDVSLERIGTAFAVGYVVVIVLATQIGPVVSPVIEEKYGWRWTFWVDALLVALVMCGSYALPETFYPQILRERTRISGKAVERSRWAKEWMVFIGRPLHMMMVEPIIFPSSLLLAVTQSVVFSYYVSYALLFERIYSFTAYKVGLTFIPIVIGSLLAVPLISFIDKRTYQPLRVIAIANGTTVPPEKRLYPAMIGSFTLPVSLFWLAWSGKQGIHWAAPVASGVLFGFSYVLNMLSLPIYTNDIYPAYSASVLAASTFTRFTVSACFPLFTYQMIDSLGFSWAMTLLAFITVAMIPVPWIFWRWGPRLRRMGKYEKHRDTLPTVIGRQAVVDESFEMC